MTAIVGKLQPFKPDVEKFSIFVDRLQIFFDANSVPAAKRVPVFLSVLDQKLFGILHDHFAPAKPSAQSFDALSAVLKSHFEPDPIVIAERYAFYKRDQLSLETIPDYVAALRRLSATCSFGNHLDDALRDRFVCGLRSESVQKELLTKTTLTFKDAVQIAQSMSSADKTSRSIHANRTSETGKISSVHSVSMQDSRLARSPCYRCGRTGHMSDKCRFKDATCHACGKLGHIAPVCKSKHKNARSLASQNQVTAPAGGSQRTRRSKPSGSTNYIATADDTISPSSSSGEELSLYTLGNSQVSSISISVIMNDNPVVMEIDTGAAVSLISDTTYKSLFPEVPLRASSVSLRTYTSESVPVLGEFDASIQYETQTHVLPVVVVEGSGPNLLGRNWLSQLQLNWTHLKHIRTVRTDIQLLLDKYPELFKNELGTMTNFTVSLELKPGARPRFHRPRPVPFALRDNVDAEISRLVDSGILSQVDHSDWAAPIVAVPKKDGKIRICGDYKVTINPSMAVVQHPLPKPDELFASVSGGKIFSKIDLSHAYQQLPLDPNSRKLVTINTHRGLFHYNRLPFGVASAPALFQRAMDTILQGLPNVICYIDDILVSSSTREEHLSTLEKVLQRLSKEGITVKYEKCVFLADSVEYLGHVVDGNGLHTSQNKRQAIIDAPAPENVQQLRSLLGLINYYGKFIPNLSSILHPLNNLLKVSSKWHWSPACTEALAKVKKVLGSCQVLVHYDSSLPVTLASDASPYGLGAVISHMYPNGEERPIAYASRTLTSSEVNYSQLEKEALSIIFALKKFHSYVYGRHFSLITDHKPLVAIFNPAKAIPQMTAARLRRWTLILSAYSYDISYRSTKLHSNADALSRLPLATTKEEQGGVRFDNLFNLGQTEALPVTASQIAAATRSDLILSKVYSCVNQGWPRSVSEGMKPYFLRRNELSVQQGCLLWGIRVIVPIKYRKKVLMELHENHPGISRMKTIGRSFVWWPGFDQEVEDLVKQCQACLSVKPSPPKSPLNPWLWPAKPWSRVHIDFMGPLMGKSYLVVVDAHSKWPEVVQMPVTTTAKTIEALRNIFATHGLPDHLVSDNGPQFTSSEFKVFLQSNGIKHTCSAPYHPATNGCAERFVQTLKKAILVGKEDSRSANHQLANFLLHYRSTPHSVTGVAPSTLLNKREMKTVLDLMRPDVANRVRERQNAQKRNHDFRARIRVIEVGDVVMAQVHRGNTVTWEPGKVIDKKSSVSFLVEMDEGSLKRRCHIDQLRRLNPITGNATNSKTPSTSLVSSDQDQLSTSEDDESPDLVSVTPTAHPDNQSRYPSRIRRPPNRFTG